MICWERKHLLSAFLLHLALPTPPHWIHANIEFKWFYQVIFQLNSDYCMKVLQGACTVSYWLLNYEARLYYYKDAISLNSQAGQWKGNFTSFQSVYMWQGSLQKALGQSWSTPHSNAMACRSTDFSFKCFLDRTTEPNNVVSCIPCKSQEAESNTNCWWSNFNDKEAKIG